MTWTELRLAARSATGNNVEAIAREFKRRELPGVGRSTYKEDERHDEIGRADTPLR